MVDALEENVMKDILSIGLQKNKGKSSAKKKNNKTPEVPQTFQILTVPRKQIHRNLAAGLAGWLPTLRNINEAQTLPRQPREVKTSSQLSATAMFWLSSGLQPTQRGWETLFTRASFDRDSHVVARFLETSVFRINRRRFKRISVV